MKNPGQTTGSLTGLPDAGQPRIAVIIPCYKVEAHIEEVIRTVPAFVSTIILVDDCSPDRFVERVEALADPRVVLVRHAANQGVGGAMVSGYRECLRHSVDIAVKMDGDGQMDPGYLQALVQPLLDGKADYSKGNRWRDVRQLTSMPWVRRVGNLGLSFLTKFASGYWKIFDPCNGYTAIRTSVLRLVPLERLARNYFFETSLLIQLNILGAVVRDVSIPARYGNEVSNLSVRRVLWNFPPALFRGLTERIWNRYFVHDFGPLTLCLVLGSLLCLWGTLFGVWHWVGSVRTGIPASAGTVMLSAMPFILGFQLLLQAVLLEMQEEPRKPLGNDLEFLPPQSPDLEDRHPRRAA